MITNSLDSPLDARRSEPEEGSGSGSINVTDTPPPPMKMTLNADLMKEFLEELEVSSEERATIEAALNEPSVPLSEMLKRR